MIRNPSFSVSELVAALNQTLAYAYEAVEVSGEIANLRVSKNRWVYFDLKDETASLRFFGSVYQLPGPLEDGMTVVVRGTPRLHEQYGFSITFQSIRLAGEGSIKKAAQLLEAKLRAEGLFDEARKRSLPYPPKHIGLITSDESAAYHDFTKILSERWGGVHISLISTLVQGEQAPQQICAAIEYMQQLSDVPDVLVLIRGGGSADDLQAFSTEQVTRAVAASRIPTIVAIGHEVDVSLAELAADVRASTPSNAAELLVPDKRSERQRLRNLKKELTELTIHRLDSRAVSLDFWRQQLRHTIDARLQKASQSLQMHRSVLEAFNPKGVLSRGYALVRAQGKQLMSVQNVKAGDCLTVELADGEMNVSVQTVTMNAKAGRE